MIPCIILSGQRGDGACCCVGLSCCSGDRGGYIDQFFRAAKTVLQSLVSSSRKAAEAQHTYLCWRALRFCSMGRRGGGVMPTWTSVRGGISRVPARCFCDGLVRVDSGVGVLRPTVCGVLKPRAELCLCSRPRSGGLKCLVL